MSSNYLTNLRQIIIEYHAVIDVTGEAIVKFQPTRLESLLNDLGYTLEATSGVDHHLGKKCSLDWSQLICGWLDE